LYLPKVIYFPSKTAYILLTASLPGRGFLSANHLALLFQFCILYGFCAQFIHLYAFSPLKSVHCQFISADVHLNLQREHQNFPTGPRRHFWGFLWNIKSEAVSFCGFTKLPGRKLSLLGCWAPQMERDHTRVEFT
jgi:hypothetical protein